MKKLALVLALTPLATQASTMNPYVRDHEAYVSWHPYIVQVGSVVAAITLGALNWKLSPARLNLVFGDCPMCLERRPLQAMHGEHAACKECLYGQYKQAQKYDYDGNLFNFQTKFNCCLCRGAIDDSVVNEMRTRYRREGHA